MRPRLIACVLGGSAPGARTELHDVAFAVGPDLEAVHEQLLDSWFGDAHGLHVDAWTCLASVTGYRVCLEPTPPANNLHLYFVNIGGYRAGEFGERHGWGFFGGTSTSEAKARAKATLLPDAQSRHKDDLYAIDDCLRIARVGEWHVRLEADPQATPSPVTNGYFPLPAAVVKAWLTRHDGA